MKKVFRIDAESGIPLIGLVQIGVIDRGSNLIQVRPTSVCNLNCIYCSTDSGANSRYHVTDYVADLVYLCEWVNEVVKFKLENGCKDVQINLDSCGEVLTYPEFAELVKKMRKINGVTRVSMQTNGILLDGKMVKELEKAGVDQINLSLNSLDNEICKKLSGCESYSLDKIKKTIDLIMKSRIELLIAPVWIPNINDLDIIELIKFCKEKKCRMGLQKYEEHKYGRKAKGGKEITYWKFYEQLGKWEKELGFKLKLGPNDFGLHRVKSIPTKFRKGEQVSVAVKGPGWMKDERIGVAENRAITIFNCKSEIGEKVKVKMLETNNGIYLSKKI